MMQAGNWLNRPQAIAAAETGAARNEDRATHPCDAADLPESSPGLGSPWPRILADPTRLAQGSHALDVTHDGRLPRLGLALTWRSIVHRFLGLPPQLGHGHRVDMPPSGPEIGRTLRQRHRVEG